MTRFMLTKKGLQAVRRIRRALPVKTLRFKKKACK